MERLEGGTAGPAGTITELDTLTRAPSPAAPLTRERPPLGGSQRHCYSDTTSEIFASFLITVEAILARTC